MKLVFLLLVGTLVLVAEGKPKRYDIYDENNLPRAKSFIKNINEFLPEDLPDLIDASVVDKDFVGKGSNGQVRKVHLVDEEKDVALKEDKSVSSHEELICEGKIMNALQKHESFPEVYGTMGKNKLLMELVQEEDGSTSPKLSKFAKAGTASKSLLQDLTMQIVKAIDWMHQQGFLHNDIKSNNVLVVDGDSIKIIDFGLASLKHSPLEYNFDSTKRKVYNKKYLHLAYELANVHHSKQSVKSDTYSIGHMFEKHIAPHMDDEDFNRICHKMLRKDPKRRPSLNRVYKEIKRLEL